MNNYSYDEINIGHKEKFEIKITEQMMESFLGITSDINPLHADREYARAGGYEDRVAYGMLTASFMSTLAGVYIPGERSLIKEVKIKFAKPVFPGDTLTIEGEVTDKNDTFNMIVLKVVMRNGKNEKVLRGSMDIMVRKEGHQKA